MLMFTYIHEPSTVGLYTNTSNLCKYQVGIQTWKVHNIILMSDTVDGRNPAPVDMVNICKYPIIYRVSYIPGGCLGFLPSTV